jgi:molybdenum cofactor cytidylyltransferase
MQLAAFEIAACEGLVLAHRYTGTGCTIAKGTVLEKVHLKQLDADGVRQLICACPDQGDLHEDVAAERLARALAPANVSLDRAATGRVNIRVKRRGIVRYDRALVRQINEIDEAITFALVQHNQLLNEGQMAATLKIIPFFVAEESVLAIESLLGTANGFSFHHLKQSSVALIQTRLPGQRERLFTATKDVTAVRLEQLGCQLIESRICAHDRAAVAAEIVSCDQADIILLCGGSAIMDRRDELPQAVIMAGGFIDHFGMPVDPGNLLMLGHIEGDVGSKPVVGMPGCARSPKLNGLDWVLQLILADIPLDRYEFADMAAGGLLMEIASRPMPRALTVRQFDHDKVAAVLLAAGQSRRMGATNKLLAEINGKPLVRHVAEALDASGLAEVVVVLGHEADKVALALNGLDVKLVFNVDHMSGQGSSVAAGIAAVDPSVTDVLVALGDMPLVTADLFGQLINAHIIQPDHQRRITMPSVEGQRGNPVIWGRAFMPELKTLVGDSGGRQLLHDHSAAHNLVQVDNTAVIEDVDTVEALDALVERTSKS